MEVYQHFGITEFGLLYFLISKLAILHMLVVTTIQEQIIDIIWKLQINFDGSDQVRTQNHWVNWKPVSLI